MYVKKILGYIYLVQLIDHPILRIPNIFFVYILFEYFFPIKVLNQYQYTPKNTDMTRYIKKKKTLCNSLNWGN